MAKTVVTPDLIKEINELYIKLKTYAGVSRALGGSPSPATVKKYIIPNYVAESEVNKNKITFKTTDLKEMEPKFFLCENWGDLCVLFEDERTEMKKLWEEMLV